MSTLEEIRQDAKRDAHHDWLEAVTPVKCSQCGTGDSGAWTCIGTDPAYGADADGRRGMTAREWECRCGKCRAGGGLMSAMMEKATAMYRTLVVDPPWNYRQRWGKRNGATGFYRMYSRDARGAECLYPVMTVEQIKQLPVGEWADVDAHLYLWTTNAHIEGAHAVARSWGFQPKTILTWEKGGGLGMGYYFRNNTEHVLFCVRGRLRLLRHDLPTAFHWQRGRHSEKPAGFYDMVESASPSPRLDVFARVYRFGWDAWGDEAYSVPGLPTPAELAS